MAQVLPSSFPQASTQAQAPELEQLSQQFLSHFSELVDPRVEGRCSHKLIDVIAIAILAVIAGAEGWEAMEEYGKSKQQWLEQFLELPNGIPSDDTYRRVFARIEPSAFERCFRQWVLNLAETIGAQVTVHFAEWGCKVEI